MEEKENFELSFDSIVELDEGSINALYTDMIESGGSVDTRIAGCCCLLRAQYATGFTSEADCFSWCRSQGDIPFGWGYAVYNPYYDNVLCTFS